MQACQLRYYLQLEARKATDPLVGSKVITQMPTEQPVESDTADPGPSHISGPVAARYATFPSTFLAVQDCAANPLLHLVIELHTVDTSGALAGSLGRSGTFAGATLTAASTESHRGTLFGWTKLYLFDQQGRLASGRWRLRLHQPPLLTGCWSPELAALPVCGTANLCVRLVDGRLRTFHDDASNTGLTPWYQYLRDGILGQDLLVALNRSVTNDHSLAAQEEKTVVHHNRHRVNSAHDRYMLKEARQSSPTQPPHSIESLARDGGSRPASSTNLAELKITVVEIIGFQVKVVRLILMSY